MGVNVTTRTVWFAVCQNCTRALLKADTPAGPLLSRVLVFDSERERDRWESEHNRTNFATHPDVDTVVWSVSAGVPVE